MKALRRLWRARRGSRAPAAGTRRDGCGRRRRGGGRASLLVQGGAAGGRLRGKDVAGAALLRKQVQRQAHHHSAGAGPGEREVAPRGPYSSGALRTLLPHRRLGVGSHISGLSPPRSDCLSEFALGTRVVGAAWTRKDRLLGGEWKGPEKSPVWQRVSWNPRRCASVSPLICFRLGPRCLHPTSVGCLHPTDLLHTRSVNRVSALFLSFGIRNLAADLILLTR